MRRKTLRFLFYSLWLFISAIQAGFSDLLFDEAYYWKYQTQLAWGYFDHPPMIAWLIKPGYWLLGNELGVRLLIILLSTGLIFLLEKLIQPRNLKLFYALISSIVVFHFIGFLALPDLPLLFFTAVFFFAYKAYLQNDNLKNNVVLAFAIAFLLYSKYHGILVVFFTVLSHLKLLRKKSFWMVAIFSFILFLPHILWQYQHDWVSLRFHLVERRNNDYLPAYTFEYLFSQPFIAGPLAGIPMLWFFVKFRSNGLFTKALKFTVFGFYIFFFFSSFEGHIEANWTFPALIPLLLISYRGIENSPKTTRFIFRAFPPTLLLILIFRAYIIYDFLPRKWDVKTIFHGWKSWANTIREHTRGKVVYFANSYQKASVYEYYSGNPSFSLNNIWGRKNQFSLWDITKSKGWNHEVALAHEFPVLKSDSIPTETGEVYFYYLSDFIALPFIKIEPNQKEYKANCGSEMIVNFKISKTGHENLFIDRLEVKSYITYEIYAHDHVYLSKVTDQLLTDELLNKGKSSVRIRVPNQPGIYYISISIKTGQLPPTINSYKYKMVVD